LNELGPSTGYALGTSNRYAADVQQPYANEIAATFQQQLLGDIVVEAGYFYRAHRNTIGSPTSPCRPPATRRSWSPR
jgi:hypothetical protein